MWPVQYLSRAILRKISHRLQSQNTALVICLLYNPFSRYSPSFEAPRKAIGSLHDFTLSTAMTRAQVSGTRYALMIDLNSQSLLNIAKKLIRGWIIDKMESRKSHSRFLAHRRWHQGGPLRYDSWDCRYRKTPIRLYSTAASTAPDPFTVAPCSTRKRTRSKDVSWNQLATKSTS